MELRHGGVRHGGVQHVRMPWFGMKACFEDSARIRGAAFRPNIVAVEEILICLLVLCSCEVRVLWLSILSTLYLFIYVSLVSRVHLCN